jgi:hypothetical protein
MRAASRLALGVTIVTGLCASICAHPAQAMDGPFTWEEVLCEADAVAEVEMFLATRTTPDHMEVRRVIWNRTKQRVRANYGHLDIPTVTMTRSKVLEYLGNYGREKRSGPPPEWVVRLRRALDRGSYRTILILNHYPEGPWFAGGVAYSGVEWLDHPKHAEWWAKIQPYLRQVIEASKRHEKPAFCADVSVAASHLKM